MYSQDELLPLSALQHMAVCPRQAGLIHVENIWSENLFTAQGRLLHDRVDQPRRESRGRVVILHGLQIRSLCLGLTGKADVVEFHKQAKGPARPFPVEYKRGRPKKNDCDRIQLCAQAMCLEEMLNTQIPAGALFYGKTRRRQDVDFDKQLRTVTEETAAALHHMVRSGKTPAPVKIKECDNCSLADWCLPEPLSRSRPASKYLDKVVKEP